MAVRIPSGRGRFGVILLLAVVPASAVAQLAPRRTNELGSAATQPTAREWSPAVAEALEAYRNGQFAAAQATCARLLQEGREARVRFDAALLNALCQLRGASRDEWREGRTRLAQLAQEDPSLSGEPECNLAYGQAQLAMNETAAALDSLDLAVAGFAAQAATQRTLAALVALAEAWAVHAEWELTPRRLGVTGPAESAQADGVRRAQIEAVRARAAALAGSADAVVRIDVVLAKLLMRADATAAEGRQCLARAAESAAHSDAAAEAALLLAEEHEQRGEWAEAVRWYEQVRAAGRRELSARAADRLQRIEQPQVQLEVPATVGGGVRVPIQLRVRGFEQVSVEVRRVDLEAWLTSGPGRGNELTLPETGSVQYARELTPRRDDPLAWWEAGAAGETLEFTAPGGALVVLARARRAGAAEQVVKKLVIASALEVACRAGPREVVVWARGPGADRAGTVTFWMRRSFVPLQASLQNGLAIFALPNEARVMRDREWLCLVRQGDQLALCRGVLEAAAPVEAGRVLLLGGPKGVAVGGKFHVAGWLLDGAVETGRAVRIEVTDATDEVLFTREVPVSAGGAFATEFVVSAALVGKSLRATAKLDGRVLDNIGPRVFGSIAAPEASRYLVRTDWPPWQADAAAGLQGRVSVTDEAGLAPQGEVLFARIEAHALPGGDTVEALGFTERLVRLNAQGQYALQIAGAELGQAAGPARVSMSLRAGHRDAARAEAVAEMLLGTQPVAVWLTREPEVLRCGQAGRFGLGWYHPDGVAVNENPVIEVWRGEQRVAALPVGVTRAGLRSTWWEPGEPGAYRAQVRVPVRDGEALEARTEFVVAAAPTSAPAAGTPLVCRGEAARAGEREGVRVELGGPIDQPLLVLVDDRGALSGTVVAPSAQAPSLFVPTRCAPRRTTRLSVVAPGPDAPAVLADVPVRAPTTERLALAADCPAEAWPGVDLPVTVRTEPAGSQAGMVVVARLIEARTAGAAGWDPRLEPSGAAPVWVTGRGPTTPATADEPTRVSPGAATGAVLPATAGLRAPAELLAALEAALAEGETLWCTSVDCSTGVCDLRIALPSVPGLYRLELAAVTPRGSAAVGTRLIDTRRGLAVRCQLPDQLSLGDRTVLAVRLENGGAEPMVADVRIAGGAGLHTEAVRLLETRDGTSVHATEGAYAVTVPEHGQTWLHVGVEASQPGAGEAVVEVACGTQRRREVRPYQVWSAPTASEAPAATLRRTVTVWSPPVWDANGQVFDPKIYEDAHVPQPYRWPRSVYRLRELHWTERPWLAGDRVARGELVHVREEFTVDRSRAALVWRQPVPANCWAMATVLRDAPGLGAFERVREGQMEYRVPALAEGPQVQEYFLGAVRPGVCLLPAPTWLTKEQVVTVAVEPAETRLIVVGD